MTDEDLIGYVLDILDPAEKAWVEAYLVANPGATSDVDRLRVAVLPLEILREDSAPQGLAVRTISYLASYLVERELASAAPNAAALSDPTDRGANDQRAFRPFPMDRTEARSVGDRFRADILVAAGIGLFAVGLVLALVNRTRYENEVLACQSNLMTLHRGLTGYADTHGGRFPQVGVESYPTAGTFISALADAGQCPPGFHPICPAVGPLPNELERMELACREGDSGVCPASYAYALGYLGPRGSVIGPGRSLDPVDENDSIPISADYPVAAAAPAAGPTSPHRWGHNVLYAGGNVRYATTAAVGVNGDDIFRNQRGQVAAGVDRADAVLGFAGDRP